jgi:NADPH:quinone reductase-like Zn-dependent oxidoreductase
MRAIALEQFGGIEQLKLQRLPVPEVSAGEVLIRMEAAGVGAWDAFEREGGFARKYGIKPRFPYVLGSDGAGTVEAVGRGVTKFKVNDRVYAFTAMSPKGGFYAEYAVAKAEETSLIPAKLSTMQAGAMPVDAMTALKGLEDTLQLKDGETLMIFGAAGGVGHLALQFAKRMGARVLAVASGSDGVELAERLGADAVVDGRKDDVASSARAFAPGGLDAALFTAGGDIADKALISIRSGGRMAYPSGVKPVPHSPATITAQIYSGLPDPEAIDRLNRLIAAGPFDVHVAETFPLERVADAHRKLGTHFLGKLALRSD